MKRIDHTAGKTEDSEISDSRKLLAPLGWWDKGESAGRALGLGLGAPQKNLAVWSRQEDSSRSYGKQCWEVRQPTLETEGWGETAWLLLPSHSPASLPIGHAQPEAWETQPVGASAYVISPKGKRPGVNLRLSHSSLVITTSHMT